MKEQHDDGSQLAARPRARRPRRPGGGVRQRQQLEQRQSARAAAAKKNYKLTLIAGVKGDEFYITMNCGAQAEAKELGVTLDFQGPDEFDASLQTPIVNAVAAKKPDAMLVAPTDTKAMYAPIKQVADAGSKVVLVDTTLDQPDVAVSQIASDNTAGGAAAAEDAAPADRRQGQGTSSSTSSRASRRPTCAAQGFVKEAKAARARLRRRAVQQRQAGQGRREREGGAGQSTPTSRASSRPTCSRAEGAATGVRQAGKTARSRSSASTPARSRSRTSRTASSRP